MLDQKLFKIFAVPVFVSSILCSCDKVSEIAEEATRKVREIVGHDNENDQGLTEEDIRESDAAFDEYIKIWEQAPRCLAQVRDEKSAIEMRKKLDHLATQIREVRKRMIRISDEEEIKKVVIKNQKGSRSAKNKSAIGQRVEEIDATVYWYILEENEDAYNDRMEKCVVSLIRQLVMLELELRHKYPVAVELAHSGILEMAKAQVEEDEEVSDGTIRKMPKDWLPEGVTPARK